MSAGDLDYVAGRIAVRYSNPSRQAYMYLFRLLPEADFSAMVPTDGEVMVAWVDEGQGLFPAPLEEAIRRCAAGAQVKPHEGSPAKMTSHQRKQMMARAILFAVTQVDESTIEVHLYSRALGFSPKGDREAREIWRRTADTGIWYSTRRDEDE